MIVAADYMRDIHVEIVDHHAEIVGGHAIRAQQHKVVQFAVGYSDPAFHQIVKGHHAIQRVFQSHHWLHARGR